MDTNSEIHQLHVIFLPFPTPGHMNPMIDTARLFAKHGVSATIITTHANASTFQKAIDNDFNSGFPIRTHLLPFPAAQVGLPEGVENIKDGTSLEMLGKLHRGMSMLNDQIKLLLQDLQPDCLVSDMFYPWTVDSAAKLGIPRLFFYSSSYFSLCAMHSIRKHKPHERLVSDDQKFTIPDFPDSIEMTTLQQEDWLRGKGYGSDFYDAVFDSERRSYGALFNSFHELESDYEQLHRNTIGIKSWSVGPVSAWVNKVHEKDPNDKGLKEDLAEEPEWLNWLNSKPNESVLYVNFGSLTRLPHAQIVEIAHGLETSGHNFIWVIRRRKDGDEDGQSFLQDFEQKTKESKKGYIIWNWAPQLLILKHPAIGGIVTHCGWNSILESLSVGLPMITWPMFAEQFYNEKLLTEVLKIGVPVGSKENKLWFSIGDDAAVNREEIAKAVVQLMVSNQESKEMRKRARKLSEAAKKTIEEAGSSYNNLMQLLGELKSLKTSRAHEKTN